MRTPRHRDEQTLWYDALSQLIQGGHTVPPSGLATLLNTAVQPLGLEVTVLLADLEQRSLRAVPEPGKPPRDPIAIDGSLAGRAFTTIAPVVASRQPGRLWVPLLDGTERLGVLDVTMAGPVDPDDPGVRRHLDDIAGLTGHLVVSKAQYGDSLSVVRRSQPVSAGAQMLWKMLPPLTFTSDTVAISAVLEPCYDVGGDAFDYAVDSGHVHIAVYDALGHGIGAATTAAIALGAARAARSAGAGLYGTGRVVDAAVTAAFSDSRFVTAVLAELDCTTGVLRYINAGHPPPVLVRDGRVVARLDQGRRLPLGLDQATIEVAELALQPRDQLLLYTDGFVESPVSQRRDGAGAGPLGVDVLIDLAERHAAAHLPPPETLRRLSHDLLRRTGGQLGDDATLMMVSWDPR